MVVLLYKSGIPTQLTTQFSNVLSDIEGFLIEFVFQETITSTPVKYNFYFKSDFGTIRFGRHLNKNGKGKQEQVSPGTCPD